MLALSGCGVGADRTVFYTTTNIGVNLDRSPPTAEISFARREGVIQPAFEGGLHLPVAASVNMQTGFLGSVMPISVGQVFSGGAAAQILTAESSITQERLEQPGFGTLCLSARPTLRGEPALGRETTEVRPFIFGTDSSLGLVVSWSDVTSPAPLPDSVRFGYRRQEMAIAPVQGVPDQCHSQAPQRAGYRVGMPSFLATIRSDASAGAVHEGGLGVGQTFATGLAARQLANVGEVREAFREGVARNIRSATAYRGDATAACINQWLGNDDATRRVRFEELNKWLGENNVQGLGEVWLDRRTDEALVQRRQFIAAKGTAIRCA